MIFVSSGKTPQRQAQRNLAPEAKIYMQNRTNKIIQKMTQTLSAPSANRQDCGGESDSEDGKAYFQL